MIGAIVIVSAVLLPAASFAVVIGPYSGRVLDSDTNEPICGASLFLYSIKRVRVAPVYEAHSELIHSLHIHAGENGAYEIQSIYKELEPNSFFESSTVIVYQPGYQVVIKKIRNRDAGEVFRTKDNIITLGRIPPDFDHNAHYRQIVGAMGGMGETPVIPPMIYDVDLMDNAHALSPLLNDNLDVGGKRMDWNSFIEKSLLRMPFESFCRRFEWENRR